MDRQKLTLLVTCSDPWSDHEMYSHKETFMELGEIGSQIPVYRPTYDFADSFIDESHRFLSECPVADGTLIQMRDRRWFGSVIAGWLRREDALKLYELCYFSHKDVLELGAYHGLSTSILAEANRRSPYRKRIYTVDLDPESVRTTERNLRRKRLSYYVTVVQADALAKVREFAFEKKEFGFVFIDHSHAYEPVYNVCRELRSLVPRDGFCLFHDFNDQRNQEETDDDYGVYQAVTRGLRPDEFEFYGIYGCSALYRAL